jgi:hypothetical protein
VDVRHVLPEKFNNKAARARRKNFSNHREAADADLIIARENMRGARLRRVLPARRLSADGSEKRNFLSINGQQDGAIKSQRVCSERPNGADILFIIQIVYYYGSITAPSRRVVPSADPTACIL